MPINPTFGLLNFFFKEVENLVPEGYRKVCPETYL